MAFGIPLLIIQACDIILRMVKAPTNYITEVKAELKQVTWPTQKEVYRFTGIVILISLIVGTYIGILDLFFTKVVEFVLRG